MVAIVLSKFEIDEGLLYGGLFLSLFEFIDESLVVIAF